MSNDYYNQHAQDFFDATVAIDMGEFHRPFLSLLPEKAYILDAGCGSGRDGRRFLDLGHRVEAFDASFDLATLATKHLGQPVRQARFSDVTEVEVFDGIWACASLLHLDGMELDDAVKRLRNALKHGGVMYASFKEGTGVVEKDGRKFYLQTEDSVKGILDRVGGFVVVRGWKTEDLRPGRREGWVNLLVRRS